MRSGRVHLLGRVWNDPQLYLTPSGEAVARFDLGTAAYGPTALGEAATCHRCLAWNRDERNLADLVLENLQSGAVVYVEGRLRAAPPVALQHVGGLWQIVVRDVQLLEAAGMGRRQVRSDEVRHGGGRVRRRPFGAVHCPGCRE